MPASEAGRGVLGCCGEALPPHGWGDWRNKGDCGRGGLLKVGLLLVMGVVLLAIRLRGVAAGRGVRGEGSAPLGGVALLLRPPRSV